MKCKKGILYIKVWFGTDPPSVIVDPIMPLKSTAGRWWKCWTCETFYTHTLCAVFGLSSVKFLLNETNEIRESVFY